MDRELWTTITGIFDAALELPRDERPPFLDRACGGDAAVRGQVVRLLEEFERVGDFLEQPIAAPVRSLSPGDKLAGRYTIEALLGRGGMGEVYRAHDELVDEHVALKLLRPELAGDTAFLRRFRREVQLARKVTHPNVCRVFDVGLHAGSAGRPLHFLTMELLDGETLAARIRRDGALPETDAYRLAVQLSDGLYAAHFAGIIHRDFKSANVMLCDGRTVITDFGLAGVALMPGEGAGTITTTAQIAGTVAYMSPEQLSGGTVTTASDIYSLGIVLFEMVTGRLPFNDTHIIQAAMQRAAETAPDVRALAPAVSPAWAAVITRCLQRDPARRFSSALSVPRHLQPGWRPPMAYWSRRQWTKAAIGGTAATAALAAFPAYLRFSSQGAELPEGAQVLIGTITNSTGEARFDGITELFRSQLAQSVRFNLIAPGELSSALTQMGKADSSDPAAIREAAWRLNAVLSIFGDVSRVGADYAVHLQIETRGSQPDNPKATTLRSFTASDPSGLMGSVRDASLWVREVTGESASSIASFDRLPSDATTPSWEALTLFARGQQYFMRNDFNPALDLFRQALDHDPQFTLVQMRRGDLLSTQYKHGEAIAEWKTAIGMLKVRAVTRAEELYGRGMFALDSGDMAAADLHFRTLSREYPNDFRGPFYRMIPLCLSGHGQQALQLLQEVQRRMPDYGDVYMQMIGCHLVLGQKKEAQALLEPASRLNRVERVQLRAAYISFLEGDCGRYLEAVRAIRRDVLRSSAKPPYFRGAFDAMRQEALLLIDADYPEAAAGRVDEFLSSFVAPSELDAQRSVLRLIQAWAEMRSGKAQAAIERAKKAMDDEPGPVKVALAGTIFARFGHRAFTDVALRHCSGHDDVPLYRQARHRILGEIAKTAGKNEEALKEFRLAAELDPPIGHRQFLIEALPADSAERLELCRNVLRHPWQFLRPPPLHCIGSLRLAVDPVLAAGDRLPFAINFAKTRQTLRAIA